MAGGYTSSVSWRVTPNGAQRPCVTGAQTQASLWQSMCSPVELFLSLRFHLSCPPLITLVECSVVVVMLDVRESDILCLLYSQSSTTTGLHFPQQTGQFPNTSHCSLTPAVSLTPSLAVSPQSQPEGLGSAVPGSSHNPAHTSISEAIEYLWLLTNHLAIKQTPS